VAVVSAFLHAFLKGVACFSQLWDRQAEIVPCLWSQLELAGGVGTMAKHTVSEEIKLGGMKIKRNCAKLSDSLCVSLLATAICHWKLSCLWDLRVIHGHYIGKDLSLLNNCLIKTFLSSGSHPFSPNNKSRNQTLLLNWSVHLMTKLFGLCADTYQNPFHKVKKHRLSYWNHGNFGNLTLPYFSLDIGGAYIFVHLEGSQQFQSTGNVIRQNALGPSRFFAWLIFYHC